MPIQINEILVTPAVMDADLKSLVEDLHRRIVVLEKAVSALQGSQIPLKPLRPLS
jgi:hypothetical protein